jgi:4-alpha-glucanotransferase
MRTSGILLAVSSLPSQYGVGDFGKEAYRFIDLLKKTGMSWWQVLPLNPLGYGNSPYQPYSSKAMDELYISLDLLKEEGLIHSTLSSFEPSAVRVNYEGARQHKNTYLKEAFLNFKPNTDYHHFLKNNKWVEMYAIFMTFKQVHQLQMWTLWDKEFKNYVKNKALDLTPYQKDIDYQQFLQYIVYLQYMKLKKYANEQGILMVGDIPIYVGIDSNDVWTDQSQFMLDDKGEPTHIAGVPPDYFAVTGQRWGNPLYRWDVMEQNQFQFWVDRLGYNQKLFDVIRIDHFRAFDTYWKIPSSCPTAVEGAWIEAPGYALFDTIYKKLPNIKIIAEDLGDLRPQVLELRDHYQLPGMKIMQFSLPIYSDDVNPDSIKLDSSHSIAYTGTHDNQTTMGWFATLSEPSKRRLLHILRQYSGTVSEQLVQYTLQSEFDVAILPMQDILSLDDSGRMNVPGTIGSPNWEWKMLDFTQFENHLSVLKAWLKISRRLL